MGLSSFNLLRGATKVSGGVSIIHVTSGSASSGVSSESEIRGAILTWS